MQRCEWTIEKITRLPFFHFARHEFKQAIGEEGALRSVIGRSTGRFSILYDPGKTPNAPAVLNTSPNPSFETPVVVKVTVLCRSNRFSDSVFLSSGPVTWRARRELYDTDEMRPDLMTV